MGWGLLMVVLGGVEACEDSVVGLSLASRVILLLIEIGFALESLDAGAGVGRGGGVEQVGIVGETFVGRGVIGGLIKFRFHGIYLKSIIRNGSIHRTSNPKIPLILNPPIDLHIHPISLFPITIHFPHPNPTLSKSVSKDVLINLLFKNKL